MTPLTDSEARGLRALLSSFEWREPDHSQQYLDEIAARELIERLLSSRRECKAMSAEQAAKILNALRIGLQLIHPKETNAMLAKYRAELEEAERIQDAIHAAFQKSATP